MIQIQEKLLTLTLCNKIHSELRQNIHIKNLKDYFKQI